MIRFVAGRLCYAGLVLLGVMTLIFSLVHLAGDPLAGLLPPGSSPAQQAAIRHHYGLDRSLASQFGTFLGRAVRGDFGESWRQNQPALAAVLERLPATIALAATAIAIALVVGLGLGVTAGTPAGRTVAPLTESLLVLGQALPGFWLGTMLILLFAVRLGWLPASGADGLTSLILPALTLAAYPAAMIARLLRGSLAETLQDDFVRTARGKGLSDRVVVIRHALRHALLPVLAFAGVQVAFLLGGAVVVEGVFAYPGIGWLALRAVADRDLPLIEAFTVVIAILILLVNVAVESCARWLDPRLRGDTAGAAQW
jgi:ABC-type dipeptide/oligopeptide/nickel transport system permease component